MITVYGRKTSGNVQIVMVALGELGLRHERIDVGGPFGGTDTTEYRTLNPNGLVPAFRDGDLVLFESAAIVRYLGAAYGNDTFWPRDPARRAAVDKWAEWSKTTFQPAFFGSVFWPLIAKKPGERDEAALAAAIANVGRLAGMIDAHLATCGDYLGGAEPCFADAIFGTVLYRYFTLDFERAETPALAAYYQRLTARPVYVEHAMISYESMRVK